MGKMKRYLRALWSSVVNILKFEPRRHGEHRGFFRFVRSSLDRTKIKPTQWSLILCGKYSKINLNYRGAENKEGQLNSERQVLFLIAERRASMRKTDHAKIAYERSRLRHRSSWYGTSIISVKSWLKKSSHHYEKSEFFCSGVVSRLDKKENPSVLSVSLW